MDEEDFGAAFSADLDLEGLDLGLFTVVSVEREAEGKSCSWLGSGMESMVELGDRDFSQRKERSLCKWCFKACLVNFLQAGQDAVW